MNVTENVHAFDWKAANETAAFGFVSSVMTALRVIIGVTGVVGNSLVIVVIHRHKKLFQQVKLTR